MDELQQALTQLLIAVVTGAVAYGVKKYRDYVNANTSEKQRAALDKALINSINWARKQVDAGTVPSTQIVVRDATSYIYANVSGIVEALGLDQDSIIKLIEARL